MDTGLIKKALEREEKPMDEYITNDIFNNVYRYFDERYSVLARKTVPHFLTSLVLRKVNINNDLLRTRKHIMLAWGPGWVKSTLLNHMMSVTPYDIDYHYTSGVTKASFRGSVVRDANITEEEQEEATRPDIQQGFIFHAPMIASYDLIGISDFSNLVNNNVLMNKFLSILEEGQVSIGMTTVSLLRKIEGWLYEKWGIHIEKDRDMTYKTNVTFWSAVHDVTKIPEDSREALLGRFRVVRVPERYLNRRLLRQILRGGTMRDEDREGRYQGLLDDLLEHVSSDPMDGERYHNRAVELLEGLIDEEPALFNVHTLRDTDKLMKDAIALLAIGEPDESVREFLRGEVYNIYLEKTNPSQLVHSLLLEDRYTLDGLSETTGMSKRRIQYLIENDVPGVRREDRHGISQYTCQ